MQDGTWMVWKELVGEFDPPSESKGRVWNWSPVASGARAPGTAVSGISNPWKCDPSSETSASGLNTIW